MRVIFYKHSSNKVSAKATELYGIMKWIEYPISVNNTYKAVRQIQTIIYPEKKIVSICLTKAESKNPEVQNSLKPLYKQYRSQKYLVAVFHSGSQNLCEATGELLRYNRRLTAEREVLVEKGRALSG